MDTNLDIQRNEAQSVALCLVSITLATRNNAGFLQEAIESIKNQTYANWELIIVDDGSTDGTEEYLKKICSEDLRISYTKNETSLGISKSRNIACAKAKGEFIAVIDSDDMWSSSEKLRKQVAYFIENPDCEVVGTFAQLIDENGELTHTRVAGVILTKTLTFETEDIAIRNNILLRQQFVHSTVVFRTNSFKKVGGYDESLVVTGDYDLILKLGCQKESLTPATQNTLHNIPEVLSGYRIHTNNITKKAVVAADEHLLVIKRYKNKYPHYILAYLKAKLRILKAIL